MFKRLLFAAVPILGVSCSSGLHNSKEAAIPADAGLESRVKEIVAGLTLEEKIGQMCQVTVSEVLPTSPAGGHVELDPEKIGKVIGKFKVGSVLNTPYGLSPLRI